jgi:hypothetical protein
VQHGNDGGEVDGRTVITVKHGPLVLFIQGKAAGQKSITKKSKK